MKTIDEKLRIRTAHRAELKALSERVTWIIGNGNPITRAEADRIEELERELGEQWDATNIRWLPLD